MFALLSGLSFVPTAVEYSKILDSFHTPLFSISYSCVYGSVVLLIDIYMHVIVSAVSLLIVLNRFQWQNSPRKKSLL